MTNFRTSAAVLAFSALLSACGGSGADDNQQITQVKVKGLAYSRQAVIQVAGIDLRANMTAVSGACENPVFNAAQSVPSLAILNCNVTATGEHSITITGSTGKILYTGTLTVPQPQVTMFTSLGSFVLELNPAAARASVNNFLVYANIGFYTNTLFHRVIPGFVAQAGGFTTGLVAKPGLRAPIVLESNKGLSNTRGSLAMARQADPNSANSQFYINLQDNLSLDYKSPDSPGYAVFGKVVQGMDVIDKIATVATTTINGFTSVPTSDVTIQFAQQTQ